MALPVPGTARDAIGGGSHPPHSGRPRRRSFRSIGGRVEEADRYRGLFENSPISLWEEDFSELKSHLDELARCGVDDLGGFLRKYPEELRHCASLVEVVDVNEATLQLLECPSKEQLIGRLPVIFRKASYDTFLEEVLALLEGHTTFETDVVNHTFAGNRIDVRVRLTLAPGHERTWSKVFVSLTDITEWKRAQARLELQSVAMDSAADAIFIARRDGTIEWVNQSFVKLTGYSREEALAGTPRLLKSNRHDEAYYQDLWATLLRGETYRNRTVNRHKDGSLYTVEQSITPITDDHGEITHFVAVQEDISERLESERQLVHLARHDFLTGLPNRYTFNERLEREAIRAARRGESVAVLLLDIDNFKDINDGFGHPVGDAFLVAVAERLTGGVRSLDTVARLGGDEFAVLQTDADKPEGTGTLAQRLLALFERPFEIEGYSINTSASIGVAIARAGEVDPKQLMRQADLALYQAKEEARGTYCFHAAEMDQELQERLTLSRDLRPAIDKEQFFLEFQPQVDLGERRVVGLEALVRWRHPERGVVPPNRFIPIAENNGAIIPLGEWVLRQACTALDSLRRATGADLFMAVNVSAVQMRVPGFAATVRRILEETGVPPAALELELTETVLVHQTRRLERAIAELHRAGVRFSVDDFGTGYSSMAYLREFAVDKLKIDRSFLEQVADNVSDAAIVSAIIALGNKLGLQVLAEGVECETQLDFLTENACDKVQGYYFSRPVPLHEIARLLASGSERIRPTATPALSLPQIV